MKEKLKKLSIEQQIESMVKKGIKLNEMTKYQAKEFLRKSNYYIRIKAFTYNFEKDKNGIYVNLDFKYLKKIFCMGYTTA